jgi:hypothetical protein
VKVPDDGGPMSDTCRKSIGPNAGKLLALSVAPQVSDAPAAIAVHAA